GAGHPRLALEGVRPSLRVFSSQSPRPRLEPRSVELGSLEPLSGLIGSHVTVAVLAADKFLTSRVVALDAKLCLLPPPAVYRMHRLSRGNYQLFGRKVRHRVLRGIRVRRYDALDGTDARALQDARPEDGHDERPRPARGPRQGPARGLGDFLTMMIRRMPK